MKPVAMVLTALAAGTAGLLIPRVLAWARSGLTLQKGLANLRPERHDDLTAIATYHRDHASSSIESLSDRTWTDLDMDSVFASVDYCVSEPGRQSLYDALHRPLEHAEPIARRDAVARGLHADPALAGRMRSALARLRDKRAAWLAPLLLGDLPPRPMLWWTFPILTVSALACLALMGVWPQLLIVWLGICVVNMYVQAFWKSKVGPSLSAMHALPAFLRSAKELGALEVPGCEAETRTLREGARSLAGLRRATRWLMFEPGPANELASAIYSYVNLLFLFDANAFVFAVGTLQRERARTRAMWEALGALDLAQSIAAWRETLPVWSVPDLSGAPKELAVRDVMHPLLAEPVANSFTLRNRSALITGSNMSGKTTFARTLGVNAVLGQTLATVCAEAWRSPVLRVCTSIGRSDSVLDGKSYYLAEVESVLSLIHAQERGGAHLFLLDEMYRGTNTVERVAAASAVLRRLDRGEDLVVVTTHDLELIELLAGRYEVFNFREEVDAAGLRFDYRIRDGVGSTRNAIALLERMGYPEEVVGEARGVVG